MVWKKYSRGRIKGEFCFSDVLINLSVQSMWTAKFSGNHAKIRPNILKLNTGAKMVNAFACKGPAELMLYLDCQNRCLLNVGKVYYERGCKLKASSTFYQIMKRRKSCYAKQTTDLLESTEFSSAKRKRFNRSKEISFVGDLTYRPHK